MLQISLYMQMFHRNKFPPQHRSAKALLLHPGLISALLRWMIVIGLKKKTKQKKKKRKPEIFLFSPQTTMIMDAVASPALTNNAALPW